MPLQITRRVNAAADIDLHDWIERTGKRASSIVLGARFAYSVRMIFRVLTLSAWIAFSFSMFAASIKFDSLAVGPDTYTNVTVLGANASDLFFTSDSGIKNVKLKYLSPELQKKFNRSEEHT